MHSLHNRLLANTIENDHKRPLSLGFFHRALCSTKNRFLLLIAVSAQPKSVYDGSSRSLLNQRAFSTAHFMNSITLCLLKTFRSKNFCETVLSKQMLMRVVCVCLICRSISCSNFARNLSHAVYEKYKALVGRES